MKISIITLFPEVFDPILNTSILKRAQQKEKVRFELIDLRPFGEGIHQVVDGKPYGGGVGMVLRADILAKALASIATPKSYVILTSASGKPYKQAKARELSRLDDLIIICGHYEGVDQRFIEKFVNEEISIGDYVLTGGEIPAMIIADSVVRLITGVLKPVATIEESFTENLLEGPTFTRPENFEGLNVPDILLSGNHGEIEKWKKEQSIHKTKKLRPDLLTEKD